MDLLERIIVHVGPAEYAEPFDPASPLKMPANAIVNALYFVVAILWVIRTARHEPALRNARHLFLGFAASAAVYGAIQLGRIVTQSRGFAIADQWATSPFFAFVVAWALELRWRAGPTQLRLAQGAILLASLASYLLSALHPRGFEVALAIHILAAVVAATGTLRDACFANVTPFVLAIAACAGFVALKLGDHFLAEAAPALFGRLTGHFWSKVCDVLQIHFVLAFFEGAHRARAGAP